MAQFILYGLWLLVVFEGLAGYTTERGEKFQDLPGHKTATLTLKGRHQGSLPLLDREDLDQYYENGSYDGKRKAEQWQRSQNFVGVSVCFICITVII